MSRLDLTASEPGRRVVFAALYLSEGAPIGFIWWFLPTWLHSLGVEMQTYTTLAGLITLAWVFKFAWAPCVDVLRGEKWGYRAWVITMQALMGLTLLPLAFFPIQDHLGWAFALLMAHGLFASTQDVAIDGWAISVTPQQEFARISAWMQAGMLVGRWLFGAGVLMLATLVSPAVYIPALVAVIWASSIFIFIGTEPPAHHHGAAAIGERRSHFVRGVREVLRRRSTWIGLVIAVLAGAGFEAVAMYGGPMLKELGFTSAQVGIYLTCRVGAMLVGALLGGWLADRWGKRAAVAVFLCLMAGIIAALAGVWAVLPTGSIGGLVFGLLVALDLAIGLFTAASYGLFMSLTDPRLGGTQFSTFMAGTNACESGATVLIGRLIPAFGQPIAFATMAGISLIALPFVLLIRLPRTTQRSEPDGASTPDPIPTAQA